MQPEQRRFWQKAIASWDGRDKGELKIFANAIRSAMGQSDRDFQSANFLGREVLTYDTLSPLVAAQLYLYTALTGPGAQAEAYLDLAMGEVETITPDDRDFAESRRIKQNVGRALSKLTPVHVESDDEVDEEVEETGGVVLPLREGPSVAGKKRKGFQTPTLLHPPVPVVVEPALTTDGAGDVEPDLAVDGASDVETGGMLKKLRIDDQLEKRLQAPSKVLGSQRRHAVDQSFRSAQGSVGRLGLAPSRLAVFELFKVQGAKEVGAEAVGGDVGSVDAMDVGSLTEEDKGEEVGEMDESTAPESSTVGGVESHATEDTDAGVRSAPGPQNPPFDWPTMYNVWKKQAGVAESKEEYDRLYAEALAKEEAWYASRDASRAGSEQGESKVNEAYMGERSMGYD